MTPVCLPSYMAVSAARIRVGRPVLPTPAGGGGAEGDRERQQSVTVGDGAGHEAGQVLQAQRLVPGFNACQGCELIASEAACDTMASRPFGQPAADHGECGITRRVSVAVVELLEVVGVRSTRVPRFLNAGRPELARQLIAAAGPHAGSGEAAGI